MKSIRIALCGNPNVGKSTVFNALTGLKQHTGNWAGKTVDSARGIVQYEEQQWELLDLPGTYSFFNGSPEEMVTSDYLTFRSPDAVLIVCDATCLERSLHLALQAASSCSKTVLCVNMMDEAEKRGITLDLHALEQKLGIPVVGVTARKKKGMDELKQRIAECISSPSSPRIQLEYPNAIQKSIECIRQTLKQEKGISSYLLSVRALIGDEAYMKRLLSFYRQENREQIYKTIQNEKKYLDSNGYPREMLMTTLTVEGYRYAGELTRCIVQKACLSTIEIRQQHLDALLSKKKRRHTSHASSAGSSAIYNPLRSQSAVAVVKPFSVLL